MSTSGPRQESLSDDELRQLVGLLARYVAANLDQWENWQFETQYGPVFVQITRELPPDHPPEAYDQMWPLPAKLRPK